MKHDSPSDLLTAALDLTKLAPIVPVHSVIDDRCTCGSRSLTASLRQNSLASSCKLCCNWRSLGVYDLPWVKVGRLVRYRPSDIASFMHRRTLRRIMDKGAK